MSKKKNILISLYFFITLITCSLESRNLIENEPGEGQATYIAPPGFSRVSGFYPADFKLKLSSEENTKIYYTTDSSDPRTSNTSQAFNDYISIYDRSFEPNVYSSIGTEDRSPKSISTFFQYKGPYYPVDKATVIRAAAKNSNGEWSEVNTKVYFVTTYDLYKYQDLTIISIVIDPDNLFGPELGIYVTGNMYVEALKKREQEQAEQGQPTNPWGRWNPFRNKDCNYLQKGKEWEREALVTIFDKGYRIIQQNMGIRIKGAFTRNNPGKSFNIYAKKKYGKSTLETDLLQDNYDINGNLITSYKSLSLRSIYDEGRLRDKFGRDLFYTRSGVTSSNMRNSVLFLNGEYWGFYLIQEKLDSDFLSRNYLIDSDNIVLAKDNEIEDGPEEEYLKFREFCDEYSKKDVNNEEVYQQINNYIDLDSLIELFATGIYISDLDWPAKNDGEWKYFGEKIEGNKYTDGKWRFLKFDLDYSLGAEFFRDGGVDVDNFALCERKRKQPPVNIFLNLLNNRTEFRNKFINTLCDYANDVYDMDKINKLIDQYRDECTDLVANSELRWSGKEYGSKLEGYAFYKLKYLKALDSIYDFFNQRAKIILNYMKEYLKLKGDLVNLEIEMKGKGNIKINNSISPKFINGKWTGKYFTRIPISIEAIPEDGYAFKEWTGSIQSSQKKEELILLESQKIILNFEK